jgi:hypothetical protein
VKLPDALRFSHERRAVHATENGWSLYASDFGLTIHEPAEPGSCIYVDVVKAWHDVVPEQRKTLLASTGWEPVAPKNPLLVLAETLDDWRDCPLPNAGAEQSER